MTSALNICTMYLPFLFFSVLLSFPAYVELYEKSDDKIVDVKLSKNQHYADGEHNADYDSDAFLGEDADTFNKMTPEAGRKSLSEIVDKIDTNKDGYIDPSEMVAWLKKVNNKSIQKDLSQTWKDFKLGENDELSWEHYRSTMIGQNGDYADETEDEKSTLLTRDKRRWDAADANKDGKLTKTEALAFFHPEQEPKLRSLIIQETVEEMDKNKDSVIDMAEYINDLWKPAEGEREPDWVQNEREEFLSRRDANHDGKLDAEEVGAWIFPKDYDHTEAETNHLISQADDNEDGLLSKDEVLKHYDVFVGSQATSYGELLPKHDEL